MSEPQTAEGLRFIASASKASKSHTERVLSTALLQAADQIEKLKERNREASALVGKLSFELSSASKENTRLLSALREVAVPRRLVK